MFTSCGAENNFTENPDSKNNNLVLDDLILDDPEAEVIATQEVVATEPDQEATVAAQAADPVSEVIAPEVTATVENEVAVDEESSTVAAVSPEATSDTAGKANDGRVVFDKRDPRVDAENYVGTVTVKFIEEAKVRLRRGQLVPSPLRGEGEGGGDLEEVSEIAGYLTTRGLRIKRTFRGKSYAEYDQQRTELEARSGQKLIDLNSFYEVAVADAGDAEDLIAYLNQFEVVEVAHGQYRLAPTAPPTSYEDYQYYLFPVDVNLPNDLNWSGEKGVDAKYAWTVPGGRGLGVTIFDTESDWNLNHLDLPKTTNEKGEEVPAIKLIYGKGSGVQNSINHGTGVLGILAGVKNDFGVTGIAHGATIKVGNSIGETQGILEYLNNQVNTGKLSVDILLVEYGVGGAPAEMTCPNLNDVGGCLPAEWETTVFAQLKNLTAAGVLVIEPAGNAGFDLDHPAFKDYFTKNDSGAIVVGGGQPNSLCPIPQPKPPATAPLPLNYGFRLNVQGWGMWILTTGKHKSSEGTIDDGLNNEYNIGYGTTSGASAIVAGVAADLLGIAKAHGIKLTPAQVRDILESTGVPQGIDAATNGWIIGFFPNLKNAIANVLANVIGTDTDGDGVKVGLPPAATDNCPLVANPDQTDSDKDGLGNACQVCPEGQKAIEGYCKACVENESIITLTSYNDYYVLTHPIMGKQYQIKTTKVAKDAVDTNTVVINGKEFSIPMKNKVMVGADFPTIQIEVTEIWPAPVDHLRLAVRSVCSNP